MFYSGFSDGNIGYEMEVGLILTLIIIILGLGNFEFENSTSAGIVLYFPSEIQRKAMFRF